MKRGAPISNCCGKRARRRTGGITTCELHTSDLASYDWLAAYERILQDPTFLTAYQDAISYVRDRLEGQIIVEVCRGGVGGVLACMCAKAGARKAFVVGCSPGLDELVGRVAIQNGLHNVVTAVASEELDDWLLHDAGHLVADSFNHVGAVVSAWMGPCLLFDSALLDFITARDRWLRPGGLLLPSHTELLVCPWADPARTAKRSVFFKDVLGVDLSVLTPLVEAECAASPQIEHVDPNAVVGEPFSVVSLDLHVVTGKELQGEFSVLKTWCCKTDVCLGGWAAWFDLYFQSECHMGDACNEKKLTESKPQLECSREAGCNQVLLSTAPAPQQKRLLLSTAPWTQQTQWHQTLFLLDSSIELRKNVPVQLHVHLAAAGSSEDHQLVVRIQLAANESIVAERRDWCWSFQRHARPGLPSPPLPSARTWVLGGGQ